MVDNVLKYRTGNLIILYYCGYSELLSIMKDVVWNSIRLMKNVVTTQRS